MEKKIAIVGAGLAGLNCARLLSQNENCKVTLLDRNSHIGGRVKTTECDGYLLDEGFQVLLPGYPEAQTAFDLESLKLRPFQAGAKIKIRNKFHKVGDPIREPSALFSTIFSPIGSLKDKVKILELKKPRRADYENLSCEQYLREIGFSEKIIHTFFRPFFSGIFLDPKLDVPAEYFLFLYQIFSKSNACLPAKGMGDMAKNLFDQCLEVNLRLDTNVAIKSDTEIEVDGETEKFDYIVQAYSVVEDFHSVTTDYFVSSQILDLEPALLLNGEGFGVINHIAPLNHVQNSYAKEGTLLSVNLIGDKTEALVEEVLKELNEWLPGNSFKHLKRIQVKKALPKLKSYYNENILNNGIYLCGDHLQSPSINGALKSGRVVAEKILTSL
jgi:phytoene dehydrogenase-like protein